MDFSRTAFSLKRHPLNYAKVQALVTPLVRNSRLQRLPQPGSYVNIGAGRMPMPGFYNVDYLYTDRTHLTWDIRRPLPIGTGTIAGIFTEHCLEHLSLEDTDRALAEFLRILQPGASIRNVVPDAELNKRRYVALLDDPAGAALPYADGDAFDGLYTPAMSINRIMHKDGHLFVPDYATYEVLLLRNGFERPAREALGKGRDARLLIDQPERAVESLYVEATKPA